MIKAILYDLDGVLVEAVRIHFDALNMALQEVSDFVIGPEEEEDFNGLPTKNKLEKLSQQGRVKIKDHKLIWQKKQDYTKDAVKKNLSPDPVKQELHAYTRFLGIKSACVTNSITETAKLMLECSGQWDYMDFLISNEMVRYPKPQSEGYIKAMVRLGLDPEECLIVEDSERGIQAAKATTAHILKVANSEEVNKYTLSTFISATDTTDQ